MEYREVAAHGVSWACSNKTADRQRLESMKKATGTSEETENRDTNEKSSMGDTNAGVRA